MASYLHTCYRIGDIDRSVSFYEKLGFEERRRMNIGDEAINVFMGLPDEDPVLELTYNHGVDSYDLGTGYNHIAIAVERRSRAYVVVDLDSVIVGCGPSRDPCRRPSGSRGIAARRGSGHTPHASPKRPSLSTCRLTPPPNGR